MRRVGQARKRDTIEPAVVQALRQIGIVVERVSGKGLPDLICARADGVVTLLEVKSGTAGRLTTAQQTSQLPRTVVRSVAEALALYGVR